MDSKNVILFSRLFGLTMDNVTADDLIGIDNLMSDRRTNIYEKIDDMNALVTGMRTYNRPLFNETVNMIIATCYPSELFSHSQKWRLPDGATVYTCFDRAMYVIVDDGEICSIHNVSPSDFAQITDDLINGTF
jgi:hypothetical protein